MIPLTQIGLRKKPLGGVRLTRRDYLITLLLVIILSGLRSSPANHAQSLILDVPYHDQQVSYYCGPATVMMVLDYYNKLDISQAGLSQELSTDPVTGLTSTGLMEEPFIRRELTQVKEGRMTLNKLKQKITEGYAPILLIWFDDSHESKHYVVAVGFNETGVFINDPWPTHWGKPLGRDTGSHVYLSNEKLLDLWSISGNWAITVTYAPLANELHKVDVEIAGLPVGIKTRLSLNGEHLDMLEVGDTTSLMLSGGLHVLSVNTIIYDMDDTAYYCLNNLQQVNASQSIQFAYTLLYR